MKWWESISHDVLLAEALARAAEPLPANDVDVCPDRIYLRRLAVEYNRLRDSL